MSFTEFNIVPNPIISGMVWFVIIASFLYMARDSAHRAIRSLSQVLSNGLRLASRALKPVESQLALRNREVLLAAGLEEKERIIDREFERINSSVEKELSGSPALHRMIHEQITSLEEDYKESVNVPPSPPGWVKAVEAVANIPARNDPIVADILEDIHESLVKAHKATIEEYRSKTKERHQLLKNMMPHWRKVLHVTDAADRNVCSLLERSKLIDRYMEEYEAIHTGTDKAARKLSSSSLNQFFISFFVLVIAVGGAAINFTLIARPMAEMVGGNSYFGDFRVADIAALVIILVEVTMGLFLMESLRITRLFPAIGALKDTMRVRMVWITFSILLALATVEAGLAYMRELLMQDELATSALLRGDVAAATAGGFTWITTVAQMGMGFILPFALVFVAIPLETFVQSVRTVLGVAGIAFIKVLSFTLRLFGNITYHSGNTLLHIYDLVIFAPLWVEKQLRRGKSGPQEVLTKDRRKVDPPELVKEAS